MTAERSLPLVVAERAIDGIYQAGQYARRDDLEAGPMTVAPDGTVTFAVWTCTPNTDREQMTVTISPARMA